MKTCKYGKLKHPRGRRSCKLRRSSKRRSSRRGRRSYRKAAGVSLGLVVVMAVGAVGAYKFWESRSA